MSENSRWVRKVSFYDGGVGNFPLLIGKEQGARLFFKQNRGKIVALQRTAEK